MRIRGPLICLLCLLASPGFLHSGGPQPAGNKSHLLYVAVPGIRNYVEYGGVGILVYDVDAGHKFVKRIPTWATPSGGQPENVSTVIVAINAQLLRRVRLA